MPTDLTKTGIASQRFNGSRGVNTSTTPTIYLDNSATTAIADEAVAAMLPWLTTEFGNPSSVHAIGRKAKVALEDAREIIAKAIGARPSEIVFTSSGTEANNVALIGSVMHRKLNGTDFPLESIITSTAEHHAILEPLEFLEKLGVQKRLLPPDCDGRLEVSSVERAIDDTTTIVSAMLVNNEVGSINPVREIASMVHAKSNALMHSDMVQAFGKMPVNIAKLGVDLASFSAHKINGPKGIGALYVRSTVELEPLIHGGAQERNRRGGTEAVALAVGFAEATRLAMLRLSNKNEETSALGEWFRSELLRMPGVIVNSPQEHWLASIINLSFEDDLLDRLDGETIIMRFDLAGIAVSNGAACTSGTVQPSHVLLAMGKGEQIANASVRVSLSHATTRNELEQFLTVLASIVKQ